MEAIYLLRRCKDRLGQARVGSRSGPAAYSPLLFPGSERTTNARKQENILCGYGIAHIVDKIIII